jgi:hypothetical protein
MIEESDAKHFIHVPQEKKYQNFINTANFNRTLRM